jgi:ATP-dependent DNA helicase Q1
LSGRGVGAQAYHANMDGEHRSRVHEKWLTDKCRVIVATIAFGMGIDKSHVRYVIHHSLSKSLENFYQESGRAGRDSLPATSVLFFRFADVFRQSSMVFTEQTGLANLYSMVTYCIDKASCKRGLIAAHFDQQDGGCSIECPRMCDTCQRSQPELAERDCLAECCLVLEVVKRQQKSVTANKLTELVQSEFKKKKKILNFELSDIERLLLHMLMRDLLKADFHFTPYSTICYLVAGRRAADLPSGRLTKFNMATWCHGPASVSNKKKLCDSEASAQSKKKRVNKSAEEEEIYVIEDDGL